MLASVKNPKAFWSIFSPIADPSNCPTSDPMFLAVDSAKRSDTSTLEPISDAEIVIVDSATPVSAKSSV